MSIRIRVKITGTVNGIKWEYSDPEGSEGSQFIHQREDGLDPSTFWWSEGNFGCDCNRSSFLPEELLLNLPKDEDGDVSCGQLIFIDSIVPIEDFIYPSLILNESFYRES